MKDKEITLVQAVEEGKLKTVEALLASGADVNIRGEYGKTPLHFAARSDLTEVAKILLSNGADVNAADKKGATPLHETARLGRTETAEALLKAGADVEAENNYGRTPLYVAERWASMSFGFGKAELLETLELLKAWRR